MKRRRASEGAPLPISALPIKGENLGAFGSRAIRSASPCAGFEPRPTRDILLDKSLQRFRTFWCSVVGTISENRETLISGV
jgi:hypothetical protein